MNQTQHFWSSKKRGLLGTFVLGFGEDGQLYFGWSRYNLKKEREEEVYFDRKVGRQHAIESAENDQVVFNLDTGCIHKGDVEVYDPEMVEAGLQYIHTTQKYYDQSPCNVRVELTTDSAAKMFKKTIMENKTLKGHIINLRTKIKEILKECIA